MEKPTNLNEYRNERINSIKKAISDRISVFLEVNALESAEVVWDADNDISTLSFSLYEKDTRELLLVAGVLHADLVHYLSKDSIPELEGYTLNPYLRAGYISFVKE